jgi:hypothetical protein
MRVVRWFRAVVTVTTVGAVALVVTATPAAAHGNPGVEPTNYEVRVRRLIPNVSDIEVRPVDLGDQIQLRNDSDTAVEVLDFEGDLVVRVPPGATRQWHEHRAVWDGERPPAVRDAPDRRHVVRTWEVEMRRGGERIVLTGDIVWVPPPSPWPWVALASALFAAVVIASRTRRWKAALAVTLVATALASIALVAGRWGATTESTATKLGGAVYGLAGIGLAIAALVWLGRGRDPSTATPAVLVAGIVIAIAGGLAHVGLLGHSQIPTDLAPPLARLAVAVALGGGGALVVAAALRLRPAASARRAVSARG